MSEQEQQDFFDEVEKANAKWYTRFFNKYLIVGSIFIIWMIFFDQNSFLIHQQLDKEIKSLENDEDYYRKHLEAETEKLNNLKNNPSELERIAREKHFLKKSNEDIFIIQQEVIEKPDSLQHEK
ncbi:septum formation initiator family protein [Vaginella massiliensis]|uniref:FtsB family cell division protein n=1 Tax=Vaginella massiliensis TaxID=1816680 RepID=UPI000B9AF475|nr:septum formation initiator family protein [Vaginella massiliensis]